MVPVFVCGVETLELKHQAPQLPASLTADWLLSAAHPSSKQPLSARSPALEVPGLLALRWLVGQPQYLNVHSYPYDDSSLYSY